MERTYDQSDYVARQFLNQSVALSEQHEAPRPSPMQVFWREFHEFLVLNLSQRDMEVLSNEYAFIGPMRMPHVNRPLRRALHDRWELSLDENRKNIEYGYACYVVIYSDLIEKMRQDFMEQEEFDAQFKLAPKIDQMVKEQTLYYSANCLRLDTERVDIAYNNLFRSQ